MRRFVATLLAGLLSSGCFSVVANGHNYVEPSIPRNKLVIRKVAILPNRLPISLQDPEYWRQFNWGVIEGEFKDHGIAVVDYETSVATFDRSGLPVEDTKSSRDKYADVAQQLGVDAIIIPYYGTFGSSAGAILIDHMFTSVATLQIYLTWQNDFLSRIDATGTYKYTTGYTTVMTFLGLVAGMIPTFVQLGSSSSSSTSNCAPTDVNCLEQASGGGGGSSAGMYAGIALGIALPVIGIIIDAANGHGSPEDHWKDAFRAGIKEGLKPFFAALDQSAQATAPSMQLTMEPARSAAPALPQPATPAPAASVRPSVPAAAMPPAPVSDPRAQQCDAGQTQQCVPAGDAILKQNPARAAQLFQRGCQAGVSRGCVMLAWQYQNGVGVPRDAAAAVTALAGACERNDAQACLMLAPLYDWGNGVAKDPARAADAYRKACEAGSGEACKQLGDRYRVGMGVTVDAAQAQQWYNAACARHAVAPGCDGK